MDDFDIQDFLPYLLNQAAEATSQEFNRYYRDHYGLLRTDWRVLFHLGQFGAMTATEIGRRASIHKTKISRAAQRLAEKRLILRQTVPGDKRSEVLSLSAKGQQVFGDLHQKAQSYDAKLLASLSPNEQTVLRQSLRRIAGLEAA
jgi:DNA-binding MarR family transcriptional regulator